MRLIAVVFRHHFNRRSLLMLTLFIFVSLDEFLFTG
jgi:hypothetical protein